MKKLTTCCGDCVFMATNHCDCVYCALNLELYIETQGYGSRPTDGSLPEGCPLRAGPITVTLQEALEAAEPEVEGESIPAGHHLRDTLDGTEIVRND